MHHQLNSWSQVKSSHISTCKLGTNYMMKKNCILLKGGDGKCDGSVFSVLVSYFIE